MSWWDRVFKSALPSQAPKEQKAAEVLKAAETIVHAYSGLLADSGDSGVYLPESALPYPKQTIRDALVTFAVLTRYNREAREQMCVVYGLLEYFVHHDDWLVLSEWNRLTKGQDLHAWADSGSEFMDKALRLIKESGDRCAHRMAEFEERLRQIEALGEAGSGR